MTIQQILIKYWGFTTFRPMQEEIINSVLDGKDTLALLPTGGGKSICFQVPALAKEGICIVISPLIALMKDQVDNLNKKGIKAIAIYSGMHRSEIDIALDNCVYGEYKLLYISPERLATELMRERIKKMNVNLLAVDESHCISQWGYDFRPPYLEIAEIRDLIPDTPIIALTATATPKVVKDIQEKLLFKSENVIQQSFKRDNLVYVVFKEEDKHRRLLRIVNSVKGSGIIYARSRKKTKEISLFLNKNGIKSDFYHAGLEQNVRSTKQNEWMKGIKRIIVATNAFGMGIDKPNVRFVVHLDLNDNVESYFQEAGRAGRDEKIAYAILLYDDSDIINIKKNLNITFPEIKIIKSVYQALGNYFQLAVGSGKDVSFDFDISDFSNNYNFNHLTVYNSLKFLEKEAYILLTDSFNTSSKIHFLMNRDELYRFQLSNRKYDKLIKIILRSYSGVFSDFAKISETDIAARASTTKEAIKNCLQNMNQMKVITYIPQKKLPQIIFTKERLNIEDLFISKKNYTERKNNALKKINSIINYATSTNKCRSQLLLSYFGETESKRCGKCDVCIERNKIELSELEFDIVVNQIKPFLLEKEHSIEEIVDKIKNVNKDKILKVIQWLLDKNKISYTDNKIIWNN